MPTLSQQQRIEKFWSYVDKSNGDNACWIWTGLKNEDGYGRTSWERKHWKCHRVAYLITFGEIPKGMQVLHHCDNPACVNPSHLWLGTHTDNMRDMVSKGRKFRHYPPGTHWTQREPEKLARGDKSGSRLHPERLVRGENHHRSKLTNQDVIEIRRRYALEGASYSELSSMFDVEKGTIARIVKRKNWTHI